MGANLQSGGEARFGSRRRRSRAMADINITPMVDVMLVLLVVFMVTAPLLSSGVPVDLPRSDAKPLTSEDNAPLEISLSRDGKIFIGETEVDRGRLVDMLSAMTNNDPERRIFIRADMGLNYGAVMDVLGLLNGNGFRKVALLSVPSSKQP